MRCPQITDFPPPPAGKLGWPWTQESEQLPETMPDGKPWPQISIVTPSYNQGQYLEETIRSVLLQGYPNLQYIIMDGGSADDSPALIRKYCKWLDCFEIAKDRGQADALNKGFSRSTGEILYFINSDDVARSGVLAQAAMRMVDSVRAHRPNWVAFAVEDFDERTRKLYLQARDLSLSSWVGIAGAQLHQPGVFWNRAAFELCTPFDESYSFAFDRKAFLRLISQRIEPQLCDDFVAAGFRIHTGSKTTNESLSGRGFEREFIRLSKEFLPILDREERRAALNALSYRLLCMHGVDGVNPASQSQFIAAIYRTLCDFPMTITSRFLLGTLRKRFAMLLGKR
jgi:glycosyltransferase involved in cell wall biosynthesis